MKLLGDLDEDFCSVASFEVEALVVDGIGVSRDGLLTLGVRLLASALPTSFVNFEKSPVGPRDYLLCFRASDDRKFDDFDELRFSRLPFIIVAMLVNVLVEAWF